MPGRPRSVSDEAIFEAVTAVISDVGPKGLTLAAVAKRVGLTASALTQRFGSKHGLLVAFATREAANVAGIFAKANNLAFLQLDLTDPELRPHAVTQSRALRAEITTLLTEAIEYGLLAPTTSPETLAADLYATYCGAMLTWAIDGTGPLPDWLTQHLERTLAPYLTQSTDATR